MAHQTSTPFNPAQGFDSPEQALKLIMLQPDPHESLMAVLNANILVDELGFESELIQEYGCYEPPADTTAKSDMNINVFRSAIHINYDDDIDVQGIYQVSFDKAYPDLCESKLASMALDLFHTENGIKCLDDFEITVINNDDEPIPASEDHESYSYTGKGSIGKIADFGIDLYGSDAKLSVDQLDEKYNPDGDGEHYQFTHKLWSEAVSQDQTASGYWVWLKYVLVTEAEQDKTAA